VAGFRPCLVAKGRCMRCTESIRKVRWSAGQAGAGATEVTQLGLGPRALWVTEGGLELQAQQACLAATIRTSPGRQLQRARPQPMVSTAAEGGEDHARPAGRCAFGVRRM
jgi:hypothetical protein